ncbi:MAG: DUF58 domain-containing protein [Candidatus Bathyarchaeota archaeon]|nr:DUF58 domain-containing protein [Candidatus Bathyarchaeota archaeon]
MTAVTVRTVAKAYLIIVLFLAVLASPPMQMGIALALLAVQLGSVVKPPKANLELLLVFVSLIFTPFALLALAGDVSSVFLILPVLPLLDQSLKENAGTQLSVFSKSGKSATVVLKSLVSAVLLVLTASLILWNTTMILTSAVLIGYLVLVLTYTIHKVQQVPLEEAKSWSRVGVGEKTTDSTQIKAKSGMPLLVSLSCAGSWVHVKPASFVLPVQGEAEVDLRFTPPLAGPSKLQVQALTVDPRGLIQTGQILEPVDLHIIPRAKYAHWLANKYLEQTSPGAGSASSMPTPRSPKSARGGLEYYGSREFQSGDRWKDMDWKHTYLLGELIVKDFSGGQSQTAVILADLTAKDADEADRLAYDFVMSALTLATESLPTALAVYNHREVLATLPPMNPREALKKALELTEKIVLVEPAEKVLQSVDVGRLRRSIGQLERVNSGSAKRLVEVLRLELEANEKAALSHPSGQALAKVVKGVSAPAVLTVVSSRSSGCVELGVTLDRLRKRGYSVVAVGP